VGSCPGILSSILVLVIECIVAELVVSFDEFGNHKSLRSRKAESREGRGFSAKQSHNAPLLLKRISTDVIVYNSFIVITTEEQEMASANEPLLLSYPRYLSKVEFI
jgi:hypothetical protein